MSDSDPWSAIKSPGSDSELITRRVDALNRWDVFWAVDRLRRCHLVLLHDDTTCQTLELPELRGIKITDRPGVTGDRHTLSIMLLSGEDRDLFYRLCTDIADAVSVAQDEKEAVSTAVRRAWRWHHLLRTGRSGRLTEEAEKGLIGELRLLETTFIPILGESAAIAAWQGPLGAPKDFEINRLAFEVKTRRGAATPFISISSADQLDTSGVDSLYLHVTELDRAESHLDESFTLNVIVERLRARLVGLSQVEFDRRLEAAGYRDEDQYTSTWLEGMSTWHEVVEPFPRITSGDVPQGIQSVAYRVALAAISEFKVPESTVRSALGGIES